jgi:hypothetical protein
MCNDSFIWFAKAVVVCGSFHVQNGLIPTGVSVLFLASCSGKEQCRNPQDSKAVQ